MIMMHKLLLKLKAQESRVLIFSQMTRLLDILEDYMTINQYEYCRIDGGTNGELRDQYMHEFNEEGSTKFCFLLSTRAGGLGINLQTADVVILYDSDWNPQVDLQAMDRAHRIGQTKTVHVYRLVAEGTVEERIVQRAQKKLFLDKMVNRGSTAQAETLEKMDKAEMLRTLKFGVQSVFNSDGKMPTDQELDAIIDRSDKEAKEITEVSQEGEIAGGEGEGEGDGGGGGGGGASGAAASAGAAPIEEAAAAASAEAAAAAAKKVAPGEAQIQSFRSKCEGRVDKEIEARVVCLAAGGTSELITRDVLSSRLLKNLSEGARSMGFYDPKNAKLVDPGTAGFPGKSF
jgi:superfamily II DNA/RNA helicase